MLSLKVFILFLDAGLNIFSSLGQSCFRFFLFAGQNSACPFDDLVLNMKHIWSMVNPQIIFDMAENSFARKSAISCLDLLLCAGQLELHFQYIE